MDNGNIKIYLTEKYTYEAPVIKIEPEVSIRFMF